MFEKVREIIAEKLEISKNEITEDTSLVEDLRIDSLDMVELIMCLEDELDLTLSDEAVATIKTVGDIVNYIESNI